MNTPMETTETTGAGMMGPPSPGRNINVAEAEKEYLGGDDTVDAPASPNQLAVSDFDFELKRNRFNHHTGEYELKNLFVRRGQKFDVDVTFNNVPKTEIFLLELTVRGAKISSMNRGTVIRLPFHRSPQHQPGEWGVRIGGVEGAKYSLIVESPHDAIVGRYDIAVVVMDSEMAEPRTYKQKDPIYVLFNPWCHADQVFMEGDVEKYEYVLNETGYLFFGSAQPYQQYARPWVFGQFEDTVIEIIFDLLETHVQANSRRDPVVVSRNFTHLINYMPDWRRQVTKTGILVGNWSGEYDDGVSPGKWTGSTKIYETYKESGYKPVKYGQCWVFSGVLNTAMRCLGIPCRSVTNFASAHDTDASMTIDNVVDSETNEEVEYLNGDSVWNFHVWNEAWFTRPDLKQGYGGWQAIDATPQESSEGLYQMGPASVEAIKQGETSANFDTKFAFAEVNADRINWVATKKGRGNTPDMKIISINKNSVGKYISTKRVPLTVGGYISRWSAREDVTGHYKYPEGSPEERNAVERAVSYGTRPNTYRADEKADDISIEILLPEKAPVGADFGLKVKVVNKSTVEREMNLTINASICFYTGVIARKLEKERKELKVPSGESVHDLGLIKAEMYASKLVDQACMKFLIFGKVKETSQLTVCQDTIFLTPPEMQSTAKVVGHEVEVECSFNNPLPIPLTGCTISFEGGRLLRTMTLFPNDVPAKETFKYKMRFSPREKGKKSLVIDFDSKQVANIADVIEIEIP